MEADEADKLPEEQLVAQISYVYYIARSARLG